ncbi:tellurite resistance methyltransferase TehB [Pusillimonas sp. MFBS29]|uniref:tellurite resistance methyltransferase TehB n=1 Tax=Pusillimonas sp. MFBS29 TaxID=2886690 RepID=UPI001D122801|nr:tellurite resistance methyltransferase TehB [Pusillimonas sp. MFBS29]
MSADLNQKYGLNPAHSEVVAACEVVSPGKALDMGCSNGRNALYLAQRGFDVTAVDVNPAALGQLQSIVSQEGIATVAPQVYDISHANLDADYDFIACTVTLMFIHPSRVDAVLADMQQRTRAGGYNLIVCAMDSPDYPCPMNFPFTFQPGLLSAAYQGWELVKYNEDVGTMHNGARLRFATMLARKPA